MPIGLRHRLPIQAHPDVVHGVGRFLKSPGAGHAFDKTTPQRLAPHGANLQAPSTRPESHQPPEMIDPNYAREPQSR